MTIIYYKLLINKIFGNNFITWNKFMFDNVNYSQKLVLSMNIFINIEKHF